MPRGAGCESNCRVRPFPVLGSAAWAAALLLVASAARAAASAPSDSGLAFRALSGSGDRFSVSDLTKAYERDLTTWTNTERTSALDLAWLDRHGVAATGSGAAAADAAADSSDLDVVDGASGRDPGTMTPQEKSAAEPPKPPVSVGIPSPVAIAGSLVGGLALLVKLITAIAR